MKFDASLDSLYTLRLNGDVHFDKNKDTIYVEKVDYFDGDREELNKAWEEFKEDLNKIKAASFRTFENTIPDYDHICYKINIKITIDVDDFD